MVMGVGDTHTHTHPEEVADPLQGVSSADQVPRGTLESIINIMFTFQDFGKKPEELEKIH